MMINNPFTPTQMIIGAASAAVLLLCVLVLPTKAKSNRAYVKIPSILTPAEKHFYKILSSIYKDEFIIMAKVRLADVVKVSPNIRKKHWWGYFSKISQKHLDILIIDKSDFSTILAIELDDASHDKRERIIRDKFVNVVMKQTVIPLVRFSVKRRYDRKIIAQTLAEPLTKD